MSKTVLRIDTPFGSISYYTEPLVLTPCSSAIIKIPTNKRFLFFFRKKKTIVIHGDENGKITITPV